MVRGKVKGRPGPFPSVRNSAICKGFVFLRLILWTQAHHLKLTCAREAAMSRQPAAVERPWPGTRPTAQDASSGGGERPAPLTGGAAVVSPGWPDGFACPHSLVSRRAAHVPTPLPSSEGGSLPGRPVLPAPPLPGLSPAHQSSPLLLSPGADRHPGGSVWGWMLRADSMVVHIEEAVRGP